MSYYTLDGFGAYGEAPLYGCCGLGAVDFNGESVWADWVAGSTGNNAAGKRAATYIQDALNQLGFGPLTVDGIMGPKFNAAIKSFSVSQGFAPTSVPTKAIVLKMDALLSAGKAPGPSPPMPGGEIVGGEYIPPTPGATKSANMLALGAVGLVAVAVVAFLAKKKKPGTVGGIPDLKTAKANKVCGYRRRGESKGHKRSYRKELQSELKAL